MKGLRSFVWSLILAFSVATVTWAADLPSSSPEKLGFSSERLARIGPIIKGEIERGQYPGAVILVARKGQIVYFESVGQLDPASGASPAG
jgi:CubicO group peptidase (beta-lactamase class C family)